MPLNLLEVLLDGLLSRKRKMTCIYKKWLNCKLRDARDNMSGLLYLGMLVCCLDEILNLLEEVALSMLCTKMVFMFVLGIVSQILLDLLNTACILRHYDKSITFGDVFPCSKEIFLYLPDAIKMSQGPQTRQTWMTELPPERRKPTVALQVGHWQLCVLFT